MCRHPGFPFVLAFAIAAAGPVPGAAQLFGSVAPQSRLFFVEPLSAAQPRWHDFSVAAEASYERRFGPLTLSTEGFGRLADDDTERSHVEAREALLRLAGDDVAADLGIHTVFWGVTESRHLVDVINQKDYLEDFDGEDKLGQLMALLTVDVGRRGFVELYAMTWFRPLRFPSNGGRPGALVPVRDELPVYEGDRGRWSPDFAARWSHSMAALDWALSYFHGTSREPQLIGAEPEPTGAEPEVVPLLLSYDPIDQAGLEVQWTRGDWLWKAEGLVRNGQGPTFAALTIGFERTLWAALGSDADVGIFVEYSYDGRDNLTFNAYDDDLYVGLRLSLNDASGTEVVGGALSDIGTGVTMGTMEASRRVGQRWTVELAARVFASRDESDPLHWFRRDDYLETTIEFHF